ncbi:MAG: hypothetical protein RMJ59_04845 [Candidatus Nitrosocaldus sp.]|nr:hypothetical protein [Candidatus Nitrosocaldus sp.]MCS7141406.1 hypothetical protein [Candidatus Nitrosocaldus sp.]MDW8000768.1 hypothetical protein [Candidatus Nitrosocaldus sp.]MDW8275691.1 hypothetical protein [Candidatus Nitrosocaldus sp.]
MGLLLRIYLLLSMLAYAIIVLVNGIMAMLFPSLPNFHYTHWILGRLTGLWSIDFIVDMLLVALGLGLMLTIAWMHHYRYP